MTEWSHDPRCTGEAYSIRLLWFGVLGFRASGFGV